MPRIETFTGTAEELAEFLNTVWAAAYAGKMTFIHWSADYLHWQLRCENGVWPENVLAAYEGERLVGTLLGFAQQFRSPAGLHDGSLWSWLSIHPDFRGRGIAKLLDEERLRRLRAADSPLILSYRYVGSKHSQARPPQSDTELNQQAVKVGMWARVLKPRAFADWHWNWFEGLLAIATGPFAPVPRPKHRGTTIRPFANDDVESCLEIVRESLKPTGLAVWWDADSLAHQLAGSPATQTLVLTVDGEVRGLVNFHVLPFQARTVERVGVFDLIAFRNTNSREQACLIDAAMARMKELGAILALKLRGDDCDVLPLLRNGFVPEKASSYLVLRWLRDPVTIPANAPLHLPWR